MSIANLRKPILGVALVTALLLLVPAIAMRLTPAVSWGPGDFAAAAALLFGAGTLTVLRLSRVRVSAPIEL